MWVRVGEGAGEGCGLTCSRAEPSEKTCRQHAVGRALQVTLLAAEGVVAAVGRAWVAAVAAGATATVEGR